MTRMLTMGTLIFMLVGGTAQAASIALSEYGFNIDGAISFPRSGHAPLDPVPAGVDLSGFDEVTGLGTILVTIGGAGDHSFDLFVDHEIDEPQNSFFNEFGSVLGAPGAGQSWEIDEPGIIFGDIVDNFVLSSLDGTNGVPAALPHDVSMAIGWDFNLLPDEVATIVLELSQTAPNGFALVQTDPDSDASIYLSSSLSKSSSESAIPEPGAALLFGAGFAVVAAALRRRRARAPVRRGALPALEERAKTH